MHRNTWKQGERRIAKLFSTYRTPLSGTNSRHTASDTLHNKLFIEVKHRKKIPMDKIWMETIELAKKENKIPLMVFIKKNSSEPILMCKLKDAKDIISHLKEV